MPFLPCKESDLVDPLGRFDHSATTSYLYGLPYYLLGQEEQQFFNRKEAAPSLVLLDVGEIGEVGDVGEAGRSGR